MREASIDAAGRRYHIVRMAKLSDTDLEELAREVACKFMGAEKVHMIKFEPRSAWTEEPLYYFWYQ